MPFGTGETAGFGKPHEEHTTWFWKGIINGKHHLGPVRRDFRLPPEFAHKSRVTWHDAKGTQVEKRLFTHPRDYMKGWKRTPSLPKSGHSSGQKKRAKLDLNCKILDGSSFGLQFSSTELTPFLEGPLGDVGIYHVVFPWKKLPACMAKRIALASGCRDHGHCRVI